MPLMINNDNSYRLFNLEQTNDLGNYITDANLQLTVCEHNPLIIQSVSLASPCVITFTTAHSFQVGDEVLVNRVVGPAVINNIWEVSAKTDTSITLETSDTTGQPPAQPAAGIVYKVVDPEIGKRINFIWEPDNGQYYATIPAEVQLIENRTYMVFIEDQGYDIQVELLERAVVRRR